MKELAERIAAMSLRQKIGQMIQAGFEGLEPNESITELIEKHHLGGVILFARNIGSLDQVASLNERLQKSAVHAGTLPLWISIDQEGGMVARITEGVALMPGNMAIAAGGSADSAYRSAYVSGRELRALGINLNFAPVLDVNVNPDNPVIGVRSFGESPEEVGRFGIAAIRGYQEADVVATAKHFPGHGDTNVDSHLDLPTITHSRERIEQVELAPFRRAIAGGVDAIMSSHIYFPAFESQKLPATLSHAVLTGLLRQELGYEGVIMTDCMEMQAISDHYGTVRAAVMAVEAGADTVLISHRFDLQAGAIEALVEAVESGRISEARIDESVMRLLALKQKRGLLAGGPPSDGKDGYLPFAQIGSAEHREVARRISEASITLVKDEQGLLPLAAVKTLVISFEAAVSSFVDEAIAIKTTLGNALSVEGVDAEEVVIPVAEASSRLANTLERAQSPEYAQIVIGTYNASLNPAQAELVQAVHALGKKLVVVALRIPYDLRRFPDVSTYLAAYESRPLALQSAAKVLTGKIAAEGKLPVTL
ncbi:beta-N-acetylhexosaminidase [Paenibacillus sp. MBLB4367]|uniref:beta-N-acetylhexosaminidase n=1 Tax=Paenibacillus sp. MBLB4367 TaxID=3384767 RepID=UPI0039080F34